MGSILSTLTCARIYTGTVLLHLFAAALGHRASPNEPCKRASALHIPVPSPFPELMEFIDEAADSYHLDLFNCLPPSSMPVESVSQPNTPGSVAGPKSQKGGEGMKQALQHYKEKFPQIEAILIGTRRTDPHGGMRIYPLLVCATFDIAYSQIDIPQPY